MGGFSKGKRLKKDEDLHRHRFTVLLTDAEQDELFDLANEWNDLFAVVFRKCFKIVCALPSDERWRLWRKVN